MAKQTINLGTTPNKGDGDPLRTAFRKINENFDELYSGAALELGAFEFGGSTITTTDSSDITIAQNVTITSDLTMSGDIVPAADNAYDLGSPTQQWRSLYLTGNTVYFDGVPLSVTDDGTLIIDGQVAATPGGATTWDSVTNKPAFANVATSGSYNDLTDTPTIPDVSNFITAADIPRDYQGSVFADDSTLLVDGVNASIPYSVLSGVPTIPADISDLTDTGNLLGAGSADSLTSSNDINIIINNDDSSSYIWNYGNTGILTLPNGQQIDAEDPTLLQIGSADAGVRLNSLNQSALLIAKKTFNREFFNDNGDYTITATAGTPHIVTVTFSPNLGLYFRQLLERLEIKLNFGSTDFIYDYSNVQINLNPNDQAVVANITLVSQTNSDPLTYELTIDQDPTAVVGSLTDIIISYDYNNTVGLDVEEDRFGIATDNDDIDIRSGRDIDLIAADDIVIQAGSFLEITLNQNDGQEDTDGIEISTNTGVSNNVWRFGFDGDLDLPQDGGIVFDRADTTIRVGMGFHIASGEGISLDAIDQTAILTLTGAGNGPVNQTYNKTNDTLYTGNDNSSVTVENLGGTWFVFIDGDAKYTSNDLIGWALSTGPGPVPVGGLSNGYKSWGFSPTGNLTLPNDAVIRTDGSNVEIGGVANFNVEASGVVNIYTDTNGETPYQWQFGDDGSLTLPGDIHGAPLLSPGPTPSQVGRIVNITPADDASDKAFRFSIDQLGETFSRAYLQLPEAEVDKQVAAVFPHSNGKAGYIFAQGTNTNDDGLNDAFNIFYNAGDIKVTAMTPVTGTLNTWTFGTDGNLTLPNGTTLESSFNSPTDPVTALRLDSPEGGTAQLFLLVDTNQVLVDNNGVVITGGIGNSWEFGNAGLIFPDATVQTTAWTGTGTADTGNVTFDDNTIQGNTLGTVGTQITVNSNYLGVTSQNSNVFPLSKTADTDQVQIGWIIKGTDGVGQTVTNKADSGGYWSFYVAGGRQTYYPITIESSDYQLGGGAQLILAVDPGDSSVKSWTFDSDGSVTFPGNMAIETTYGGGPTLVVDGKANTVELRSDTTILIGYNDSSGNVYIGNPEGTGQVDIVGPKFRVFADAPTASTGAVGDQAGQIAFNGSYIYYCTADYTNGVSNIWKRVAWSGDTW